MRKVRIFQFPFASNSGVKQYALNNWNHMDKNKFSCDFGTVRSRLEFEDEITDSGAGVRYISCTAENNREKFIDEMTSLFKNNYDVVHLHTSFWKSFLVEEIAKNCNIPKIIVHSHSTFIDIIDDNKRREAEMLHNSKKNELTVSVATDFWACSNLAADWLFGTRIPKDKIKIMNNAIDIGPFIFNKEIRDKYRREFGLEDCFVIGTVGRLAYQKNQGFLIKAFAGACSHSDKARLIIIGEGPLESELKELSEELNVSDKVIFTGTRTDVECLLQAMDLFCLPSRFEGLPISLIEAQTAGLKCIAGNGITDEVCITDNIKMLPLEQKMWEDEIIKYADGYERKNMYDIITGAGYNIDYQIREIEKNYLDCQ